MQPLKLKSKDLIKLSEDILRAGGSFKLTVLGNSMFPFIREWDQIMIIPVTRDELSAGDVIIASPDGANIVVHRITGFNRIKNDFQVFVRGDAFRGPAEVISEKYIFGKVVSLLRKGKLKKINRKTDKIKSAILRKTWPVGTYIVAFLLFSKRVKRFLLRKIQNSRFYRKINRILIPGKVHCEKIDDDFPDSIKRFFIQCPELKKKNQAFLINQKSIGEKDKTIIVSFRIGKKIIGLSFLRLIMDEEALFSGWWVSDMRVLPNYRGAGVGTEILNKIIDAATGMKIKKLFLSVDKNNRIAFSLFTKFGFTPENIKKNGRRFSGKNSGILSTVILSKII